MALEVTIEHLESNSKQFHSGCKNDMGTVAVLQVKQNYINEDVLRSEQLPDQ